MSETKTNQTLSETEVGKQILKRFDYSDLPVGKLQVCAAQFSDLATFIGNNLPGGGHGEKALEALEDSRASFMLALGVADGEARREGK